MLGLVAGTVISEVVVLWLLVNELEFAPSLSLLNSIEAVFLLKR